MYMAFRHCFSSVTAFRDRFSLVTVLIANFGCNQLQFMPVLAIICFQNLVCHHLEVAVLCYLNLSRRPFLAQITGSQLISAAHELTRNICNSKIHEISF